MDEKHLRELVIKAIELIQSEKSHNITIPKKKLYVIMVEEWNGVYWDFFERLNKENQYDVYGVISNEINNSIHINNLKKFKVCKDIINEKDVDFDEISEYITIFPIVPRNIVIKTALCIDDTFETNWIFKCMEKGQRIIFLSSGLQKFSGKEPLSYRNKILEYYRTLLEFDIEISDWIIERESKNITETCKDALVINRLDSCNMSHNENRTLSFTKKVITEKEIENYVQDNKIIINNGDIITDMARDKARSLNISIIRSYK